MSSDNNSNAKNTQKEWATRSNIDNNGDEKQSATVTAAASTGTRNGK